MKLTKGQATRLKILEAAKIEFSERGFENASLRKIADDAGVTTGSLYCYFESKLHLFESVVDDIFHTFCSLYRTTYEATLQRLQDAENSAIFDIMRERTLELTQFVYGHYPEFVSLLQAPLGTPYHNFLGRISEEAFLQMKEVVTLLRGDGKPLTEKSEQELQYASQAEIETLYRIVVDNAEFATAKQLIQDLEMFFRAGYIARFIRCEMPRTPIH